MIDPQDVRDRLTELKARLLASMGDEQRLYQRHLEASRGGDRWRRRAELAVAKGAEDLARGALERAMRQEERAAEFQRQYLEQKEAVERLKRRLLELEGRAIVGGHQQGGIGPKGLGTRETAQRDTAAEKRARLAALAELERDEVAEKLEALERKALLERQLEELKKRIKEV